MNGSSAHGGLRALRRIDSAGSSTPEHDKQPLTLKMDVSLEPRGMSVDLDSIDETTSGSASAVLLVRLPRSKSFSITYDFNDPVRDEIVRIRRRYAEDGSDALADADQGKSSRYGAPNEAAFLTKISKLLRWQEFLDLADALDGEGSEARGLTEGRDKLLENVVINYRRGISELREQLLNQRAGPALIRMLLHSGSDLLANLGLQLLREPSLRLALQDDLAQLADDDVSPDVRRVASGHLRAWTRTRHLGQRVGRSARRQ
jgi:hypothetical protein